MNNQFQQEYQGNWLKFSFITVGLFILGSFIAAPFYWLIAQNPVKDILMVAIAFLAEFLLLLVFVLKVEKNDLTTIGIKKLNIGSNLMRGGSFAFVFMLLIIVGLTAMHMIELNLNIMHAALIVNVLLTFPAFCIQATTEELFFRGYLQTRLTKRYGDVFAIIVSSIMFMLVHVTNPNITLIGIANIFLAGIFLSLVYRLDGSIWSVAGFHIIWNFVQNSLYGINVSGNSLGLSIMNTHYLKDNYLTGGSMGIEGSIFVTGCFVIIILYLVRKIKVQKIQS